MAMLSGGQKSRVAFAALTAAKPHVIIMDEARARSAGSILDVIINKYSLLYIIYLCSFAQLNKYDVYVH